MTTLLQKTDASIQQDVLQELKWDARVEPAHIGVEVDAGVVTLTGTVATWAERIAAQEAAHRVRNVLDVANDINVKVPGGLERNDADIARAVRLALEWDAFIPERRIRTTVANGVVTLEGEVTFLSQREAAAQAVRNFGAVRDVVNRIVVKPPQLEAPEIQAAIRRALERQADREAERIHLDVHEGRVIVSGVVHSWAERQAVLGAAKGTPGVLSVEDRLSTKPYA